MWFVFVSYLPWPVKASSKHLPQIDGPPPGTAAKAYPTVLHWLSVKGTWLIHVVAGPPSHLLLAFLSEIVLPLASHCLHSFPFPALAVHEQLGLQQSQYLEAKPDPENPPLTYVNDGHPVRVNPIKANNKRIFLLSNFINS